MMIRVALRYVVLVFVAIVGYNSSYSQNAVFSKLSADASINYVHIPKTMLSEMSTSDVASLPLLSAITAELNSIDILSTNNENVQTTVLDELPECVDGLRCVADFLQADTDSRIKFYVTPGENNRLSHLLMIKIAGVNNENNNPFMLTAILLDGDIDAGQLKSLTQ